MRTTVIRPMLLMLLLVLATSVAVLTAPGLMVLWIALAGVYSAVLHGYLI